MEHMTEDEYLAWCERHDRNLWWYDRWRDALLVTGSVAVTLLVATIHWDWAGAFAGTALISVAARMWLRAKHRSIDDELEDFEE